jgi:hypothetical protein
LKCVEFESRLNYLLDERLSPSVDQGLSQHAQHCSSCSDLLAAHEALLEGVAVLPFVRLGRAEQQALAGRVAAEVGNAPLDHFRSDASLDVAEADPPSVARGALAPLAIITVILATAAAILIALVPMSENQNPASPSDQIQHVAESPSDSGESANSQGDVNNYEDLALIARVGYEVADGLTPVTSSMVSVYREWRKRPFFKGADEPHRSSFYLPQLPQADAVLA